jgi:cysteine desulfurase/selenocysteine lyase
MPSVWEQFRQKMPICENYVYLDHAAISPLPAPVTEAIQQWLVEAGERAGTIWGQWVRRVEKTRNLLAQLIGASAAEIALLPNTSVGIGMIAEGLPWKTGDSVVLLSNEFPSNQYPWWNLQSRGVEIRSVPTDFAVDLDAVFSACDETTRVISLSWVGYASGWRVDIEQLVRRAHDSGIAVVLDAIQGLGVIPIDVNKVPIDFMAAGGHKWLMGPESAGMLYIRKDRLDTLRPTGVGWKSVKKKYDYANIDQDWIASAARFEGGTQNISGLIGLGASVATLLELGAGPDGSDVFDRILEVADYACERIESAGGTVISDLAAEHRSSIISFEFPNSDSPNIQKQLFKANVVISQRAGRLRISPHAYNNQDDIDRMVHEICRVIGS